MGCLKKIFNLLVTVFCIIGIITVCNMLGLKDKIGTFFEQKQETALEKAMVMADLSEIDSEFKVDRAGSIIKLGKFVVVEHPATSQKTVLFLPDKNDLLIKNDFNTDVAEEKINNFIQTFQYQMIRVDNLVIKNKGHYNILEQNVPYLRFGADVINLPIKGIEGTIGVAQNTEGKNFIILNFNEYDKYSDIISQALMSKFKKSQIDNK